MAAACVPRGGPQVEWGPLSLMGTLLDRLEASRELLSAERLKEETRKKLLSIHKKQTETVRDCLETKAKDEIKNLLRKISHLRSEGISGAEEPHVKEIQQQASELEALEKQKHISASSLEPLRFSLSRLVEGVNSEAVDIPPPEEDSNENILGGPEGGPQGPPGTPPLVQGLGLLAEEENEEDMEMLEDVEFD